MSSNQYFKEFSTVEQIKAEYRRLAMKHHPDRGGDTETMQEINRQYHAALQACNGQKSTGSDQQEHTYTYKQEVEQAVMDALDAILKIRMDTEVMLIGTWIWVVGNTRPVKDQLKDVGCKWHSKRMAWYWRSDDHRSRWNSKADFSGLAEAYGCKTFTTHRAEEIAA